MDAESVKPRINGSMLSSSIGKYVCIVGKNLGVSHHGGGIVCEDIRVYPLFGLLLNLDLVKWTLYISGDE